MPRKVPDYPSSIPQAALETKPRPLQIAVWLVSLPRAHHRQKETERPSLPLWFCRRVASRLSFSNTAPWGRGLCGSQAGWRYRKLNVTSPAPLLGTEALVPYRPGKPHPEGPHTRLPKTSAEPREEISVQIERGESLVGGGAESGLGHAQWAEPGCQADGNIGHQPLCPVASWVEPSRGVGPSASYRQMQGWTEGPLQGSQLTWLSPPSPARARPEKLPLAMCGAERSFLSL